jgi:hypothetical protein
VVRIAHGTSLHSAGQNVNDSALPDYMAFCLARFVATDRRFVVRLLPSFCLARWLFFVFGFNDGILNHVIVLCLDEWPLNYFYYQQAQYIGIFRKEFNIPVFAISFSSWCSNSSLGGCFGAIVFRVSFAWRCRV